MDSKYTALPISGVEMSTQTDDYDLDSSNIPGVPVNRGYARKVYAIVAMQLLSMFAVGASLYYFECTCHFIYHHKWTLRAALSGAVLSMAGLSRKFDCQALNISFLSALTATLSYFVGVSYLVLPGFIALQTLATASGMLALLALSTFKLGFEQVKTGTVALFAFGCVNLLSLIHATLPFDSFAELTTAIGAALAFVGFVLFVTRESARNAATNREVIGAVYYVSMIFFNPYVIYNVLHV